MSAASYVEGVCVLIPKGLGRKDFDDWLAEHRLAIFPVDSFIASLAADAFERYGKGRHPAALNFGDCFSYALAKSHDAPLLYKGRDFAQTDIKSAV